MGCCRKILVKNARGPDGGLRRLRASAVASRCGRSSASVRPVVRSASSAVAGRRSPVERPVVRPSLRRSSSFAIVVVRRCRRSLPLSSSSVCRCSLTSIRRRRPCVVAVCVVGRVWPVDQGRSLSVRPSSLSSSLRSVVVGRSVTCVAGRRPSVVGVRTACCGELVGVSRSSLLVAPFVCRRWSRRPVVVGCVR